MTFAQQIRDSRFTKLCGSDEVDPLASISKTAPYAIESEKTERTQDATLRRIPEALPAYDSKSRKRKRAIRNPQYAPEFLERKLSPSSVVPAMPPAEIQLIDDPPSCPDEPLTPADLPPAIPTPDDRPPRGLPGYPVGPADPK